MPFVSPGRFSFFPKPWPVTFSPARGSCASPIRIPRRGVGSERIDVEEIYFHTISVHTMLGCRRGDSKQNSTRPRRTGTLHISGLTSDYVESGLSRPRDEKVPKTALGPPRGLVGVGPDPISGLRGPNLPTDMKHAPRAQTRRRSWTPIACLSIIAIFAGPTIRAGLLGRAGPRYNRAPRWRDPRPQQSHGTSR
jgi:hypothetical protein